jgi:hypothetical protein
MRLTTYLLLLYFIRTILLAADIAPPGGPGPSPQNTNRVDLQGVLALQLPDGSFPATISRRDQDFRRWERISLETNGSTIKVRTNCWIELQTGMHYRDAESGQWVESAPQILITNTDAIAIGAPHRVWFSGNINSPVGVEVTAPDAQHFKLHIAGLAYYDFKSQTNLLIAELKAQRVNCSRTIK